MSAIKKIKNKWQSIWINRTNNNYLKIKKNFYEKNDTISFTRRDQVKLTRIRISHTNITHVHLMKKTDPPQCEHCDAHLTMEHIILNCQKHRRERHQENINAEIYEQLNKKEKCELLIKFIKKINIYNQI